MPDVLQGVLIGLAIAVVAAGGWMLLQLIQSIRKVADETHRTVAEVRVFLASTSTQLERLVTDVSELKAKFEPLADPARESLERIATASRGIETFGASLADAGHRLAAVSSGNALPLLTSIGSMVMSLVKRKRKGA